MLEPYLSQVLHALLMEMERDTSPEREGESKEEKGAEKKRKGDRM